MKFNRDRQSCAPGRENPCSDTAEVRQRPPRRSEAGAVAPSGEAKGARLWGLAAEWGVTCTEATEKISPGFSPKYMAGKWETTGQS